MRVYTHVYTATAQPICYTLTKHSLVLVMRNINMHRTACVALALCAQKMEFAYMCSIHCKSSSMALVLLYVNFKIDVADVTVHTTKVAMYSLMLTGLSVLMSFS